MVEIVPLALLLAQFPGLVEAFVGALFRSESRTRNKTNLMVFLRPVVLRDQGAPAGCMLLNRCPEQRVVELVYIGLAPGLRGRGLSRPRPLNWCR